MIEPFPPEALDDDAPAGTPPATAASFAPVWDHQGRRWDWTEQGYRCADPDYPTPLATTAGAIPDQPTYATPPPGQETT